MLFLFLLPLQLLAFTYNYLPEGVHVLVVDPLEHEIFPVKAEGKETVQALALKNGAQAAISGGFFKKDGTPAGVLKIGGVVYGMPHKFRGAIGWSERGRKVKIDRLL